MNFKRLLYLSLFFCLSFIFSFSQENTFYHYGLEQGLSQQTVRCILKDSKGFLWLGTQDGLNRFDGNTFRVFRKNDSDSLAISGKFINDIIENDDGTIWIATANNGVCYYSPKTDVFSKTSFNAGNCTSLSKDNKGNVYATSLNNGVFVFTKYPESYEAKHAKTIDDKTLLLSSSLVIDNTLYLGSSEGSMFKANLKEKTPLNFEKIAFDKTLGIINEMHSYDNAIFIGASNGLFKFQPDTNKLSNLQLKQYDDRLTESLVIESLASKNNTLHVGTDNGLYTLKDFNPKDQKFENTLIYKGDKDNINSITSNRVYDILIDNDLLWIGTNNLDVASLKPPVFETINSLSYPAINNNYVFSILKTEGYTFIGTRDGLNCIDNSKNVTYITKENTDQALAYNVIRGMTIDGNNNLWLATTKGVSVLDLNDFDPENPKIISFFSEENNSNTLSENKTRSIFLDHNQNIWVTTYGGGINRFSGNIKDSKYTFERYNYSPNKNSISSNFTFNMTQDADYNYWITSENGLNKLEFENSAYDNPIFTIYKYDKTNPLSLRSNTTLHTCHDKDGVLWIATQNGLHKFNKADASFTQYNESHGLSNTYVYSILEDQTSNLWVSTNSGLFKFNKNKEQFTQFTIKDGLQSTEFNLGASFNDIVSNKLYFGGINGFNIFDPRAVYQLDNQGKLLLTELGIKGTIINPITHSKVLTTSITGSKSIELNYNDFPCTITFSDLNLRPQKNTQFVYRLNNSDWNSIKDSREIQLLDLPKGKHNIELQGMFRNQLWKTTPLQLVINVTPPWYKSNLAYLGYLLTFLLIIYQFYRLSLKQQLAGQKAKRLQELDALKSRFITNITHEFRTPLTIIMGYVDTLKNVFADNNPQSRAPLKSIERNSENLLNLVNEMLDLAKLEQGKLSLNTSQQDIVKFTQYLVNSFSSLAESKAVTLYFKSETESIIMDFDPEKWRQVMTNLISNAIKFTDDNSVVSVLISQKDSENIKIIVSDSGIGISKENIPFIFDRFYQVQHNSNPKLRGTGIGLALTKELIELMNGSISVQSKIDESTTFSIELPITKKAELKQTEIPQKGLKTETFNFESLSNQLSSQKTNTVLIVEDNEEIAHYIGSCLTHDYNLEFALNGEEGMALAETTIPDIIITDVMMPIMDGFELTKQLQANTTTNHIPIIMLTAKAMQDDKLLGIKSGADAYLTKPFQKEELVIRIEMLIAKRKQLQEKYAIKKLIKREKSNTKADKNLEFLETVIQHIHKNIENSDYNAIKLAADLYMSESQLYRKLKALTNKSSAIFIRSVRLEKAKALIEYTSLTISEIAYAVGFSNPNWFGKAFKEEFGTNPSELRS